MSTRTVKSDSGDTIVLGVTSLKLKTTTHVRCCVAGRIGIGNDDESLSLVDHVQ